MPSINNELDWQIWFAKNDNGTDRKEPVPFYWTNSKKPLTFRSAYPYLKSIFEVEENGTSQKPEPVQKVENRTNCTFGQGRKPKKFTAEQAEKMIELRAKGLSYAKIGAAVRCSKGTVRNYLKEST